MRSEKAMKFTDCSIDDLPVELVLTIFKFLDNESRLNVRTTCKNWKNLADNWFSWPLILDPSFDSYACEELIKTKRKFYRIHLRGEISFALAWKFLEHADLVLLNGFIEMTINQTTFQLLDFNNFMKKFPNLESVDLSSVKLPTTLKSGLHINDDEKPEFKQLKTLNFSRETDPRLLPCFTNAKLTRLNCREQQFTHSTIWEFLSTQKELQEIDFDRSASSSTFEFGAKPTLISSSLKKIALDYKSVLDFDGITDLVLHQPNNFESVELGHIPDISFYAIIFTNLKNLKTLHLMPGSVRRNMSNQLQLQPLQFLTNLRLYDGVNYGMRLASMEEMTIKIIENSPNLEDLELFVPYRQIFYQSIVTNLKKLKSLTIRATFNSELQNLKYPPVEKLRINCFNFGQYGLRYPPISMVAEQEETGIYETVRSLTYDGATSEHFFGLIRRLFPKLEVLEIRKDLAKFQHTKAVGIRHVHYRENNFFKQVMRFN